MVEVALMQEHGIMTTLLNSKYSLLVFVQRKANSKLRIFVALRWINQLIKNDYVEHNNPLATISDAAHHIAGEKYMYKLICSQGNHFIQMADEQPVQLLSFIFGSRTFAYKGVAQGSNRSKNSKKFLKLTLVLASLSGTNMSTLRGWPT